MRDSARYFLYVMPDHLKDDAVPTNTIDKQATDASGGSDSDSSVVDANVSPLEAALA